LKQVASPRRGEALGGKVAIVYCRRYQVDLGGLEKLHSFDIHKYARIYLKLTRDGLIRPEDVFVPQEATREQILLVHTGEFLERLKDPKNVAAYLEAPVVRAMPAAVVERGILKAMRHATGGTIRAGREALDCGVAINIGGGFHHAGPEAGEGFNIYADIAIAIRVLKAEGLIERALVVDLDVHQGNGTADIFAGDDEVFTFSMHQRDIYPIHKAESDLDVELDRGTDDETYLELLGEHLPRVIERARPDIIFLQAGCDTLAADPLAGLEMTEEGIVSRDAMVIDEAVSGGIPVVMTLGGGYSKDAWQVQYASIRRTIGKYAAVRGGPASRPGAKERYPAK
jgi:histone deacetylase 11